MAGDEKLVLNHALCFLFNRLHKSEIRQLKVALLNFNSSEDICSAKEVLAEFIKAQQNADIITKIPRRRESEERVIRELDDIFNIITDLDAAKLLGLLPKFVSDSPDKMPSLNPVEGDLSAVIRRFDELDSLLNRIESSTNCISKRVSVSAIVQGISHESACEGVTNKSTSMNERTATAAACQTNVNNPSAYASTFNSAAGYVTSAESGFCAETSDADDAGWRVAKDVNKAELRRPMTT